MLGELGRRVNWAGRTSASTVDPMFAGPGTRRPGPGDTLRFVQFVPVLLLALAGFFAGGAYAMWKTTRVAAVVLAVLALLALAAGIAWLL